MEKGLRHAARIGDLRTLAVAEYAYSEFLYTKGDWKAAAEHGRKSIEYAEEVKWLSIMAWGRDLLGRSYAYLGNAEMGRSYVEKGLEVQQDAGIEWRMSFHHVCLGDAYLQLGDLEKARRSLEEALQISQKSNDQTLEARAWILLGRVLGRTETELIQKAEECILHGMKIAEELKWKPIYAKGHFFLGELYARAREGQKETALEHLTKAEAMFQEMGMDYWLAEVRKIVI